MDQKEKLVALVLLDLLDHLDNLVDLDRGCVTSHTQKNIEQCSDTQLHRVILEPLESRVLWELLGLKDLLDLQVQRERWDHVEKLYVICIIHTSNQLHHICLP